MGAEKVDGFSLPLLRGILPIDTNKLASDILAGVTLAALGIPEVNTKISGTPIVTGLYTLLLSVIAFALLGGSRHLVVSADSATAAILASILVGTAALGAPEYVGATSLVALVVAGMLVLARVFKLGFLADFLSRSARRAVHDGRTHFARRKVRAPIAPITAPEHRHDWQCSRRATLPGVAGGECQRAPFGTHMRSIVFLSHRCLRG